MFTKKKKMFLLSAMVALLILTAVLNVALNKNVMQTGATNEQTAASFFAGFRTDREYGRQQQLLVLDAILADPTTTVDTRTKTEAEKLQISNNIEIEVMCENLIKAQGYPDAIITTGDNFYHVVVNAESLTKEQVAAIADIVQAKANTKLDNIIVSYLA